MSPSPTRAARFVEPMLLLRTDKLPDGAQWQYELPSDRLQIRRCDPPALPERQGLQHSLPCDREGRSLPWPDETVNPIRESPVLEASLPDLIRSVKAQGLEGIVAKRVDSRHKPGQRSGAWQKMRVNQGQEFVIGGYTPAGRNFDAVIFGYYDDEGRLIYAVRTRNGFTPASRDELFRRFRGLETNDRVSVPQQLATIRVPNMPQDVVRRNEFRPGIPQVREVEDVEGEVNRLSYEGWVAVLWLQVAPPSGAFDLLLLAVAKTAKRYSRDHMPRWPPDAWYRAAKALVASDQLPIPVDFGREVTLNLLIRWLKPEARALVIWVLLALVLKQEALKLWANGSRGLAKRAA